MRDRAILPLRGSSWTKVYRSNLAVSIYCSPLSCSSCLSFSCRSRSLLKAHHGTGIRAGSVMSLRHVKYNGLKPEIRARTQSGCLGGGGDDGGVLVAFQERHLSVLEIHLFYLLVLLTSYVRKRGTALKGSEEFFRSYYLKRKVESRCLYTSMNLVSRQSISYRAPVQTIGATIPRLRRVLAMSCWSITPSALTFLRVTACH